MNKACILLLFLSLLSCSPDEKFDECQLIFGSSRIASLSDKAIFRKKSKNALIYTVGYSAESLGKLKAAISEGGFGEWKTGGVTYGHTDVGWSPGEGVEYARKKLKNGTSLTVAINPQKGEAYFIQFPVN